MPRCIPFFCGRNCEQSFNILQRTTNFLPAIWTPQSGPASAKGRSVGEKPADKRRVAARRIGRSRGVVFGSNCSVTATPTALNGVGTIEIRSMGRIATEYPVDGSRSLVGFGESAEYTIRLSASDGVDRLIPEPVDGLPPVVEILTGEPTALAATAWRNCEDP